MNTKTAEKLIARRVKTGAAEADSRALLAELVETVGLGCLAACLHYQGFSTLASADRDAEALVAA